MIRRLPINPPRSKLSAGGENVDAEKLGAFIAENRKAKGMTQADLAGKLQVTDKAVSRWERGIGLSLIHI